MAQRKIVHDGNKTVEAGAQTDPHSSLEAPLLLTEPSLDSISPEAIPETDFVAEPSSSPKRSGSLLGAIIGGVLAAVIGFGLAQYMPGGWPFQDVSALKTELESQAKDIEKLNASLTSQGSVDEIEQRLTALETVAPEQNPIELSPLEDRIASIDSELSALKNASGDGNMVERLRQLQARIDALENGPAPSAEAIAATDARVQAAESAAAASVAEAEKATIKSAQALVLSQVSTALVSGVAFSDLLAGLDASIPEALSSVAETGVPTITALQTSFPAAARNALDAALRADMGEGWIDRATILLKTQTGARSLTPREGNDPDAILSRAEAALTSGDLQNALAELAALPNAAQVPMAEWQALARKRVAATQAFAEFSASLGQ